MSITYAEYQERVKHLKTPQDKNALITEFMGTDLDAFLQDAVADRLMNAGGDISKKILSLKSKGMTNSGIQRYFKEAEGVDLQREQISRAMDRTRPEMDEWFKRPLARMYPIVFLDGMRFSVKDNGRTISKCSYHMIGINTDGVKELLGIWISDSEGAKFWSDKLAEIKTRGVEDILIACVDGLKGFPQAIKSVYPKTTIQLCINHMTRNTTKHIHGKQKEDYYADLKDIYQAPSEETALAALQEVKEKWGDLGHLLDRWENEWANLSTFFNYTPVVRRLIYTTNHVESLHSEFRRMTRAISIFPNEDYLRHMIWFAQREVTKRWITSVPNWGEIISQLAIQYPDRDLLY